MTDENSTATKEIRSHSWMSPELLALCERAVTEWQENAAKRLHPEYLEELIRNAIEYDMDRIMGQFMVARHGDAIAKIADKVFDHWIDAGLFGKPSQAIRNIVDDVLTNRTSETVEANVDAYRERVKIAQLRMKGMSQRAIADKLGISVHAVRERLGEIKKTRRDLQDEIDRLNGAMIRVADIR